MNRALAVSCLLIAAFLSACVHRGPEAGAGFRDCPDCPEMVVVPPGSFAMGADLVEEGRPEGPVRKVHLDRAFAVGRYEVTQEQFTRFVMATGRVMPGGCRIWTGSWQEPRTADWTDPGYGRVVLADEPVTCITWQDARDYVDWLATRTGKPYRLLSEAEWEYAARAGTDTIYYWGSGEAEACRYGNLYDQTGAEVNHFDWAPYPCDDGFGRAAPVGQFRPNAFGLYDMLGNVWEWTEDCYLAPYPAAPVDGRAYEVEGACAQRTVRGGSWLTRPGRQRVTFRGRDPENARYSFFGFRIARDL